METLDNGALNEDEQLLLLPPYPRAETEEVLHYMENCFIEDVRDNIHELNEFETSTDELQSGYS